ncbi:SulP family inorganic anion transporter [Methylomonas sp. CM2]|uniref:SulP family inorganic anion transporter n=1 Tax=Methylomonas sp. CM2 TaxID=3417647 RepID=UPI003CF3DD44
MTTPTAAGSRNHWPADISAGFQVFLIALPLCLGIALASGFPPLSGVISAIVGGLLVSRIGGAPLTITGPAAGLIVVILDAAVNLGDGDPAAGYRYTLAAIVCAGLLQIALGYLKAGRYAALFPASVIHGMLAAIGIIIIAKQLPVMAGVQNHAPDILTGIGELPRQLIFFVPQIGLIALAGIAILIGWPHLKHGWLHKLPAPIVVIASGILLGQVFGLAHPAPLDFRMPEDVDVVSDFLVNIPADFSQAFSWPDFGKIASLAFWQSVISICLVGSLESLLSAAAVDKLDPLRRYSDLNRELRAIGIANTLSGLMGGLPMIAEIVRSSANIEAGAQTSWANFCHGVCLLVFVALFPSVIATIPLASLAALLVYTGFRLASPKAFAKSMDLGKEQLLLFLLTIAAILVSNLLAGALAGIAAKVALHVGRGVSLRRLLSMSYHIETATDGTWTVKVSGAALFSNFLALKSWLTEIQDGRALIFDLSEAELIDHTVMEFIAQYREDYIAQGGRCEIRGLSATEPLGRAELSARVRKPS